MGYWIALLGAALAVGLSCVGSSIGVGIAGQAASGLAAEQPEKATLAMLLEALPGTQGIYGTVVAFLVLLRLDVFGGLDFTSEAFTVAGYIFFQNCEQAQRQKIFLYSSIPDEQVRPMGMRSFSDMTELLKEAKLDGKSIYVIPNGATVVPHVC